jgi:carbon-monoxide dehydrogenase large subunit
MAVVDVASALADGAPLVHDDAGTNRCYDWELANGDRAAFDDAPVKVTERIHNNPRSSQRSTTPSERLVTRSSTGEPACCAALSSRMLTT